MRDGPMLTVFDKSACVTTRAIRFWRMSIFRWIGEFTFLTGPSGTGKSSFLRLVYGAEKPTSGRIFLFGHDLAHASRAELPALRRQIGVVFQDFRLIPHLTAFENAALPLRPARGR